jgi:hypothetical protein
MLINVDTPDAAQYLIYDCDGNLIPCVTSFDTETEEIELAIRAVRSKQDTDKTELPSGVMVMQQIVTADGKTESVPILVRFILPGAYALKDGKPIN